MVYENDADNYYDEFYGIGGDDHVNGYGGIDKFSGDGGHEGRSIWDAYGDEMRNASMENHTEYGGYGSYKDHGDTGVSAGLFGGGGDCGGYSQVGELDGRENGHSTLPAGLLYCGGGDDGLGGGEISVNEYVDGAGRDNCLLKKYIPLRIKVEESQNQECL
ncbi:hypothetical protein Btru_022923 [Bulinus truncatus]|nr:hypothetical protein Btru_022923 [Bulinus truncatus]